MRQRLHLNSSSVFCGAKYRGGARRAEGVKFPFSFPAKEKGRKRKLPADVRKRKNSLRESGEKNSPGAPVPGRSHTQLIRATKPSRAAQTAFPLGRLTPSFFCIAFSHRPDFNAFFATFAVNTRDRFKLLLCVLRGAKYRGGARRAEGFKSSHIQVFNLFFFNPSPRGESPSEPPLYRYPTRGRSVDATLFPYKAGGLSILYA